MSSDLEKNFKNLSSQAKEKVSNLGKKHIGAFATPNGKGDGRSNDKPVSPGFRGMNRTDEAKWQAADLQKKVAEQHRLEEELQRQEEEKQKLKEAWEYINQLKKDTWDQHINYTNTENLFREYKELFSKSGGVLNYVQRFVGLAVYDLENYKTLEELQLKCKEQIISGLSLCLKGILMRDNNETQYKGKQEFQEEAFYSNLGIDASYIKTLESCNNIINKLKKNIDFQAYSLQDLKQQYNNIFYEKLWNNMKVSLVELLEFGQASFDDLNLYKEAICSKATDIKKCFEENGISFIFLTDCTSQEEINQYFVFPDTCDKVPAIIRRQDNYIYFVGKFVN